MKDLGGDERFWAGLSNERTLLRTLIDNLPDSVYVKDAASRIMLSNVAHLRMLGAASLDDALGKTDFAFFPQELAARYYADEQAIFRSGQPLTNIVERTGLGDDERWVLTSKVPLRDEQGTVIGLVGISRDISERMRMDQALSQSEARFRTVFGHAGVGMAILDTSGFLLECNSALQQALGYSPDELAGHDFFAFTHAEDAPAGRSLLGELHTGKRVRGQILERRLRKDGKVIWCSLTCSAVQDPYGKPQFVVAMIEDITAHKESDDALQQRGERLRVLHEIDRAILAARSAAEIAQAAVGHIRQLIACLCACVQVYDFEAGELVLLAVDAEGGALLPGTDCLPLDSYGLLDAHQRGEIGVLADLQTLEHVTPTMQTLMARGVRSYTGIPLVVGKQLAGALVLSRTQAGTLAPEELAFARQVADSLSVALQNARLIEQLSSSRRQLQGLSHRLVEVQENERHTIARELHDEAGQALTSLLLGLGSLERDHECTPELRERLDDLRTMTNGVMEALHRMAVDLRPASLDRLGLVPALDQYVQSFRAQHGLSVHFAAVGAAGRRLPPDVETAFYRVTQEALTNVLRHAGAGQVSVLLQYHDAQAVLIIEDDGKGFDVEEAFGRGRLGLLGIRERAEMLGGLFTIESSPGNGTTIYVAVPLAEGDQEPDAERAE